MREEWDGSYFSSENFRICLFHYVVPSCNSVGAILLLDLNVYRQVIINKVIITDNIFKLITALISKSI